jgi:hypothetical protein
MDERGCVCESIQTREKKDYRNRYEQEGEERKESKKDNAFRSIRVPVVIFRVNGAVQ